MPCDSIPLRQYKMPQSYSPERGRGPSSAPFSIPSPDYSADWSYAGPSGACMEIFFVEIRLCNRLVYTLARMSPMIARLTVGGPVSAFAVVLCTSLLIPRGLPVAWRGFILGEEPASEGGLLGCGAAAT